MPYDSAPGAAVEVSVATIQSGLSAEHVLEILKQCGITHVVWLPDSEANFMYQALAEDPDLTLVPVCREAETMAIAVGLLAGGKRPVCMIQSTGFMESGDSVRGLLLDLLLDLKIPMLLIIGYRGWRGGGPVTDSAAHYLEPTLKAWDVSYHIVESDTDMNVIVQANREAEEKNEPVAVLITREWER